MLWKAGATPVEQSPLAGLYRKQIVVQNTSNKVWSLSGHVLQPLCCAAMLLPPADAVHDSAKAAWQADAVCRD